MEAAAEVLMYPVNAVALWSRRAQVYGAAYWIYNLSRLPPLDDFANVIDEFSNAPDERDLAARGQQERIPPIYDLPITHVNAVLFPRRPAGRAGASSSAG